MPQSPEDPEPSSAEGDAERIPSRRRFLSASGWGAAGLVTGAVSGGLIAGAVVGSENNKDERYGFSPLPARPEPGFDHLVVLMFENRSFDHVLGRLYDGVRPPRGQAFEGVRNGEHPNRAPDGTAVASFVYDDPTDVLFSQPNPDPGETYPHVNTQLFGVVDPPSNADPGTEDGIRAPWNAPESGREPTMDGFVHDYVTNYRIQRASEPSLSEYSPVMGGFTPEMLPVFSALARSFAVFDHWHCAVPSQTFCNRSFFHASTSHGFVTNGQGGGPDKWLNAPDVPTLFNRLQDAGLSWRVYYDAEQVVSLTGLLHAPSIERYWKTNFRSMDQFREDAANGDLPVYSFIEPRMVFDHNDMHPPENIPTLSTHGFESAFSDVRAAEALLADVYTSIRNSSSAKGSNAINTALLVTFDEHGGLFDHVPPPSATPPSGHPDPGEMGFTFDRLGLRVPTILVSAYVEEGTVESEPTQHASVASSLTRQHGLKPLTERDKHARTLQETIRLTVPRQPQLWPDVQAPYVPANPERRRAEPAGRDRERPLTSPAKGLLGLLLAKYEPQAARPETFGDAYDTLHRHGELLFGTTD
ncbi:hypothetical protein HII28_17810 [Planctomonas sp. JC2975]|uniref:alkaline phosphatase family protein n=1 Tax=Planctomonas sp. JC2975 TaxID=2729626 RepID=UPI001474D112|nr:alkaline phosphatase family protein [Planctomonas sp. JC2975]NNC13724.1 hypothetical protein [Planctomonas sp. JC2975]